MKWTSCGIEAGAVAKLGIKNRDSKADVLARLKAAWDISTRERLKRVEGEVRHIGIANIRIRHLHSGYEPEHKLIL